MRMPVGYAWAAAGIALVGAIAIYALGFAAGGARARAEGDGGPSPAESTPVQDPLHRVADRDGAGGRTVGPAAGGADKGAGGERSAPNASQTPTLGGPDEPRTPGWYYFVVAQPKRERAPELADFLRRNGLDAAVVRDHNGQLRKVIVLPGWADKSARSSPEVRQLRDRITAAGRKWKAQSAGNADFGDAFPELYRPAPDPRRDQPSR